MRDASVRRTVREDEIGGPIGVRGASASVPLRQGAQSVEPPPGEDRTVTPLTEYELGRPGAQRDYLISRVLAGVKTMTSSLLVHLRIEGADLPMPGQRFALVDSSGLRGTVEIAEVRLLRLADIGTDVAHGEGEDFGDVSAWRRAHELFWAESDEEVAVHLGLQQWHVGDDDIVVVEVLRLL